MTKLLPYDFNSLTDEMKLRLQEELHENNEIRESSLKALRCLLNDEENLYYPDEDNFLVKFLRARKYDVKKAASTMRSFFQVHKKYPDIFQNFDYASVAKTVDENILGFLPYRDEEGSVILVMRVGKWNPYVVSMADAMRSLTAALYLAIQSPATQVAGFKVIVDFKGFSLRHVPHVSPAHLLLLAEALQNCFPGRFRAVHIVNEGPLFSYIWAILKNLLSRKLKERFLFHGKNEKKLHQYFPPTALPEEYGGSLGPFDVTEWAKKVKLGEDIFMDVFTYGYNKSKDRIPH